MLKVTVKNTYNGYTITLNADTVIMNPVDIMKYEKMSITHPKYAVISWGKASEPDFIAVFNEDYIIEVGI